MTKWLILRTASRNTLKLAEQLREGFYAWAPSQTFRKRAPRNLGIYEVTAPILPGYVFAPEEHVTSLMDMALDPMKPCVDFSVMLRADQTHAWAFDFQLDPLRQAEESNRRKLEKARLAGRKRDTIFTKGEEVRVTFGPFAGMTGVVVNDKGKDLTIDVGLRDLKISASHLVGESVVCPIGPTAKAA